jgi:hypothetical protein
MECGVRRADVRRVRGSGGAKKAAPTSSPRSVSIVGRNINCRNKNGLFSSHRSDNRPVPPRNIVLFKYDPPERVDVLERRMIFLSRPSVFNDPFEMQPYFQPTTLAAIVRVDGAGEIVDTTEEQLQIEMEGPRRERAKLEEQQKHTCLSSQPRKRATTF